MNKQPLTIQRKRIQKYTSEIVKQRGQNIHGCKYDYSYVTDDDVAGRESRIPVMCNICAFSWTPSIATHIINKSGCPACAGNLRWTLERFITRGNKIHNKRYDYSQIIKSDIENCNSRVSIKCSTCSKNWLSTINNHVKGRGCPYCNMSKGENACMDVLKEMNVNYVYQFVLPTLPRRFFDFQFEYEDNKWILEFDGAQHFEMIDFFHRSSEVFSKRQAIDITKTKAAIDDGYNVIRIDHTQLNNVAYHIQTAVKLGQSIYFSTRIMYEHYNV